MRLSPILLASLVAAAPAAAQPSAPWADRLPPKTPGELDLTLDRYRYFIDCEATSNWTVVAPLFDTRIGSREEERVLDNIGGGDHGNRCSYALSMEMTAMLMRGGIAEARYRYLKRNDPRAPVGDPPIAEAPEGATFKWVAYPNESPAQQQYDFANCLAEKEPALVGEVLATRMMTKQERVAMQRLSRAFGQCLEAGQELRADMLTLRPWLGEAAFQELRSSERSH